MACQVLSFVALSYGRSAACTMGTSGRVARPRVKTGRQKKTICFDGAINVWKIRSSSELRIPSDVDQHSELMSITIPK